TAAASLLARLRRRLDGLEAAPEKPRETVEFELDAAASLADSIRVGTSGASARATPRYRVVVDDRTPLAGDVGPMPLWTSCPWEGAGRAARLRLGGWPAGDGALARDPRGDRARLELCLARAGPGRAEWAAAEAHLPSRVRQALGLEAMRDAWERYAEVRWIERAGASRAALEAERRALE